MIKKILLIMFFVLCNTVSNGATSTYLDTEQKYFFSSETLQQALLNKIDNADKREAAAQVYVEVMNQETGQVSVADLFKMCRAAGFNTYRKEGFDSCLALTQELLNTQEDVFGGFCPGLDAAGNNPNALRTITDKTSIGDFCSSTNIYSGEVVFRKGYNCTCMATACNSGFEFKSGACVTQVADSRGFCLRKAFPETTENNTTEKCKNFCEAKYKNQACKFNSIVMRHSTKECICNANSEEIDAAKESMKKAEKRAETNRLAKLSYYEVCGNHKNKTDGTETCEENIFNWTNVGQLQAVGLAQEYARIKHNDTIQCSKDYRTAGNDDYIKCVSTKQNVKHYYEFKFDDVKESLDAKIQADLITAICTLHGKMVLVSGYDVADSCADTCSASMKTTAAKFGFAPSDVKTPSGMNVCSLKSTHLGKNESNKLAKIDGIDNYVFYHGIQIQGSQTIVEKLRQQIEYIGVNVQTFTCDSGVGKIQKGVIETDDVLRCYLNSKPIDFVFDDFSELNNKRHEGGMQAIACIVKGGTFSGSGCLGLNKEKCDQVRVESKKVCPSCEAPRWDYNIEQCVLPAGADVEHLEQGMKVGGILVAAVAGAAITIATGGAGAGAAVLLVVELTGSGIEFYETKKIQETATRFLESSNRCKSADCAEAMVKEHLQRLANMQNDFTDAQINAIDTEMARLFKLIPETSSVYNGSRLSENQLSMFRSGSWEPEQVWRAIGVGLQMASLFAGIGKWIIGKSNKLAKTTGVITKQMQKALTAQVDDVADASRVLLKTSGAADDVADVLSATAKTVDNAVDASKAVGQSDDVVEAIWDASVKRFRDPKTGKFVSGYKSFATELAENGVKETIKDGKAIYTDIKTGQQLSDIQVLNRIPTSMNDEFATIGVRQVELSNGSVRYMDILPGGENKFISEAEVLKRIDGMSDASKAVGQSDDVLKLTSKTDEVITTASTTSKVGDIAKIDKEATEAMSFVDANRLRNGALNSDELNKLRKYYPDLSEADLQIKAKSISQKLDAQRMMNGGVTEKEMEAIQKNATDVIKSVQETSAKTGDELINSLRMKNWNGKQQNGFYYMFIQGRSGGQHATGLKFHISVDASDLDRATDIIGNSMKNSGVGGQFKVFLDPGDASWMSQTGKEFTVYVSEEGYNSSKLQKFVRECEQGLRNAGVKTNGFGSNVSVGDRAVGGSRYIKYRYDQLDDFGIPQGAYRAKYDFVAPSTQYGGDIMHGINAM